MPAHELISLKANLEKQMKELNVRVVDLETKSLNSPKPATTSKRLESRIEELTNQLNQSSKDSSRVNRSADRSMRDARFQLAEADRQRSRLEDEVKAYEGKLQNMRQALDELVCGSDVPILTLSYPHIYSKHPRTVCSLLNVVPSVRLPTTSKSHSSK